ncbi:hypothetical protein AAZX31_08G064400 [Glycine max]|uniref:KIB1-4 beta-propeller domain-containing protein n=1 Tax=Glycine max TaxID=3847 RepID=K7L5A5_SOYBN|nr:hypothetical protein JHK87_020542 [Glycine soja]KAG5024739.1 hypothetical protein JHK86_020653 [Glycine max]KAG5135908.1 hypothetical protein JHK82_020639 [Glycine max]KAH1236280.1 F-box/kelch-repeat protein [Glycine max]KRH42063.1 hypothetical protein GLYMA_08G066300v4 [Glycine max]
MALKAKNKKKQQPSGNKEVQKSKSWLDLPNQLINTIQVHQNLDKDITSGGIIKSWRTSPKHCNSDSKLPWLQLTNPDGSNTEKYRTHITRRRGSLLTSYAYIPSGFWCRHFFRKLPRYPWENYVGCSNGILIAEAEPLYMYHLWNPTQGVMFRLPLWDPKVPIKLAVLSSPTEDPNCTVMVLTGIAQPAFTFYKLRRGSNYSSWITQEPQWTMQDCTLTESLGRRQKHVMQMQFTNAIGFKGKFYVLSVQGSLVVIENIDSVPKVMDISGTRIFPSVSSNHFREYLLESDGEVLLVFLISRKSSVHSVDDVEVYQLNMGRLSWVKLESVGERAVLVGSNCSMSVLASEVGCRKNCIYFKHPVVDEWCVHDMELGNIRLE